MMTSEEIKKYLPSYLSAESYSVLIKELSNFPSNVDSRFYWNFADESVIFQGDGINSMPIVLMESLDKGSKWVPCLIFSNTCDLDLLNKRPFGSTRIVYAPIVKMSKYKDVLISKRIEINKIEDHFKTIREQRFTQIFYLPKKDNFEESIVFLDKTLNIDNTFILRENLATERIFSLSNYGFYLFLFKLSVHFSRIQERVDRSNA